MTRARKVCEECGEKPGSMVEECHTCWMHMMDEDEDREFRRLQEIDRQIDEARGK